MQASPVSTAGVAPDNVCNSSLVSDSGAPCSPAEVKLLGKGTIPAGIVDCVAAAKRLIVHASCGYERSRASRLHRVGGRERSLIRVKLPALRPRKASAAGSAARLPPLAQSPSFEQHPLSFAAAGIPAGQRHMRCVERHDMGHCLRQLVLPPGARSAAVGT